jgi:hypothetical protein
LRPARAKSCDVFPGHLRHWRIYVGRWSSCSRVSSIGQHCRPTADGSTLATAPAGSTNRR